MTGSIGVLHPPGRDPAEFADLAAGIGYDRLYAGELWGSDSVVELARAAPAPIDIGTAIVNVFSRSPATLAQAAATLANYAHGNVILGLGTSTQTAVESLHGTSFDRPVRRLHETAEAVRRILHAASSVSYDGEVVTVDGAPGFDADIPVYTAALGPAARRATGRVADGWIPHNIPFDALADAFETIETAAREAGRDPEEITVAPYVPTAVDRDPSVARDALRGHLAYYVGSGEGYRRSVAETFPDAADAVADAWRDGDRSAARAAVTEEMLDRLGVAGTPETAVERFRSVLKREPIDAPIVVVPRNASELVDGTVEALEPLVAGTD